MTENKNICEEIEIALYSDTELSEEQKKHIECCESCSALLLQINKMKSDLGTLSVPGLNEGEITKAVMEKLAKKEAAIPFPKFKITHHLGTAAAIVIILAAVLIMKNPSEPDFENESNDTAITFTVPTQNNHVLSGVVSNGEEAANDTEAEYSDKADGTQSLNAFPEEETVIMRSFDEAEESVVQDAAESEAVEQNPVMYNYSADIDPASLLADVQEAATEIALPQADDVQDEEVVEDKRIMMFSPKPTSVAGGGSSGGSGGAFAKKEASQEKVGADAVSTEEGAAEDYDSYTDVTEESLEDDAEGAGIFSAGETAKYIFEGIEFSEDENDFEYNVSLANDRLYELYGKGYVLSSAKLRALGVDNQKLLELAPTVTDEMFNFYSGILDVFE